MQSKTIFLILMAAASLLACNVEDSPPSVGTNNANADNCDACGVCDDDPDNDCVEDCAGTPGGSATEDACGVCDDDPSNDCAEDCAGTLGGAATEDACGVCDDDPDNDCVEDCEGTPGGTAFEDECGVCDSEPQNDCQPDCAGTFGGDAYEDACGVCDADPANDCVQDCEGVANGDATLDFCGRCTGGTTGRLDCTVIELPVVADATVDADNAATNFGAEVTVNAESDTSYGLFKYDLTRVADDDVVYNVELGFTAVDGEARAGDGTTYVEALVGDRWLEADVTWGNQPDGADAELVGSFDATDSTTGIQAFTFASSQLAGHIAREAAGNDLATIRLRTPGYKVRFASKEGAADSAPVMRVGVVKAREAILEPVAGATIETGRDVPIPSGGFYDILPGPRTFAERAMLLRFDLSSLPANAQIERVFVIATAANGYAYGGNGNVYTTLVDDDSWDEQTVTAPGLALEAFNVRVADNLGFWWLWYNRTANDQVGVNGSLKLVPVVQQELVDDQLISFYFGSAGYETTYYDRMTTDASKRPRMRILYTLPGQ